MCGEGKSIEGQRGSRSSIQMFSASHPAHCYDISFFSFHGCESYAIESLPITDLEVPVPS